MFNVFNTIPCQMESIAQAVEHNLILFQIIINIFIVILQH